MYGPLEARVTLGANPFARDALERFRGHAGVRRRDGIHDVLLTSRQRALDVAFQQRGEGFLGLPLRMSRREQLDAIDRELELEIDGLFRPERAVVVERGDALRSRGTKSGVPGFVTLRDERDDGLLGTRVVPGWQRILRRRRERDEAGRQSASR